MSRLTLLQQARHGRKPVKKGEGPLYEPVPGASEDKENAEASKAPVLELTYNWDSEDYTGGRNFGHLAFEVDDIYQLCADLQASGVTINRPPRDGYMAFIRSPDGISIELLQKGGAKDAAEPWQSMENTGSW